jgi:hypothetical protein
MGILLTYFFQLAPKSLRHRAQGLSFACLSESPAYVNFYQWVEFSFSVLCILMLLPLNCFGINQSKQLKSIVPLYELKLAFFLLLYGSVSECL